MNLVGIIVDIVLAGVALFCAYKFITLTRSLLLVIVTALYAWLFISTQWNWLKIPMIVLIIWWMSKIYTLLKVIFGDADLVTYESGSFLSGPTEVDRVPAVRHYFFIVLLFGLGLIYLVIGSYNETRREHYVRGVWVSDDGSVLSFHEDGTLNLSLRNTGNIHGGEWKIRDKELNWYVENMEEKVTADISGAYGKIIMQSDWKSVDGKNYRKHTNKPEKLTKDYCKSVYESEKAFNNPKPLW